MYVMRLQKSGSQPYVYLPKRLVEKLGWERGDEVIIDEVVVEKDVKTGRVCSGLLIYRVRDYKEIWGGARGVNQRY